MTWLVERRRCDIVPLHHTAYHEGLGTHFGERLAITGAVSNPRARTIDPRRYGERRTPKVVAASAVFALSLIAWGLIVAALWALKLVAVLLWRSVDGWVIAANLFLALVAISLGAGIAWAGVTITEAALMRWVVTG